MTGLGIANGTGEQAWLFQASPARYAIFDSLATERVERWNLRQHASRVRVGDRVYIWISGDDAGIYAVGKVLTAPMIMSDTPVGIRRWTDPQEGRRPIARVDVRYNRSLLDRPLLKVFLLADPALRDLGVIRSPRGTNFPLTAEEAAAIDEWLSGAPAS